MAAAIRSDDPVVFFEHKGLFASKGPAAPEGHVVELGQAAVARAGSDVTLVGAGRHGADGAGRRRAAGRRRDLRRGHRPALPGAAGHGDRAGVGRRGPRGWSSSRRTPTRAAGAAPSPRSSPTRASSCSTPRSAGWPPPASRCRSPTRWSSRSSRPWTPSSPRSAPWPATDDQSRYSAGCPVRWRPRRGRGRPLGVTSRADRAWPHSLQTWWISATPLQSWWR